MERGFGHSHRSARGGDYLERKMLECLCTLPSHPPTHLTWWYLVRRRMQTAMEVRTAVEGAYANLMQVIRLQQIGKRGS